MRADEVNSCPDTHAAKLVPFTQGFVSVATSREQLFYAEILLAAFDQKSQ